MGAPRVPDPNILMVPPRALKKDVRVVLTDGTNIDFEYDPDTGRTEEEVKDRVRRFHQKFLNAKLGITL